MEQFPRFRTFLCSYLKVVLICHKIAAQHADREKGGQQHFQTRVVVVLLVVRVKIVFSQPIWSTTNLDWFGSNK